MAEPKIARGSLPQTLRDELESAILRGDFAPGVRLDETLLANRYGVSRTPIREALTQLVAAGLLVRRPRRGVVVAEISSTRLVEMFEVMAELEAMAGRLAARRHTAADVERLSESHLACKRVARQGSTDDYYYANEHFHQAIYAASHSEFLQEQCLAVSRRLKPFRRMQLEVRNRVSNSFEEHESILAAILGHHEAETDSLLRSHVMIQNNRFTDLMAALKRPPRVSTAGE